MAGCLIIHGYTGGPFELQPLTDYLRAHFNWDVEVPLLPGHGETLVMEDMLHEKWLAASEGILLQLLQKHHEVYLIGFSMGGMIASYLAAKYRITKLVLLAPSRKFLSFRQVARDAFNLVSDSFKGKIKSNQAYMDYSLKLAKVPIRSNLEFLRLVRMTRNSIRKITVPVLIAQGRQDRLVPYQTVSYLDKEIASNDTEIVLFENSGHGICLGDDKDALNKVVAEFLLQ